MSLLDEAKSEYEGRTSGPSFCTFAGRVASTFPEEQWPEVVEMLESDEIDGPAKIEVLARYGVKLPKSTLLKKQTDGCRCQWCRKYWRGPTK